MLNEREEKKKERVYFLYLICLIDYRLKKTFFLGFLIIFWFVNVHQFYLLIYICVICLLEIEEDRKFRVYFITFELWSADLFKSTLVKCF